LINIIISCANNENDKNINNKNSILLTEDQISSDIIKKDPLFNSLSEDFQFNHEENLPLDIISIILSKDLYPAGDETFQRDNSASIKDVKKIIGDNQLVFTASNEQGSLGNGIHNFEIMKKGMVKIGDDSYDASLYYNDHSIEGRAEFQGMIVVSSLSIVQSLPEGELIILTKGRKK